MGNTPNDPRYNDIAYEEYVREQKVKEATAQLANEAITRLRRLAAQPERPARFDIRYIADWLTKELRRLGYEIENDNEIPF